MIALEPRMMTFEKHQIVVLISADEEWRTVKQLTEPLESMRLSPFGEWFPYNFDVQGRQVAVVFLQTGCGKIPAAAATQFALNKWNPQLIINLGTCGGFKGKVKRSYAAGGVTGYRGKAINDLVKKMM